MRLGHVVLTLMGVTAVCATAAANGRPPATVGIHQRDGEEILVAATFGLLISSDSGQTFDWVCERNIGYQGTYDPDYAIHPNGDIFVTTFDGLRVSRDGACTFVTPTIAWREGIDPTVGRWIGQVEIGADGRVWAATTEAGQSNQVYVSNDGQTFVYAGLEVDRGWWSSLDGAGLAIAPSDPNRLYIAGYIPRDNNTPSRAMLYRSTDGGSTWEELPVNQFAFALEPTLLIEAVSPTDPNLVFARTPGSNDVSGDRVYRSADGGLTWENVLSSTRPITVMHVRGDGNTVLVASSLPCPEDPPGANKGCVWISEDRGSNGSFSHPEYEPMLECLAERGAGTLWGCGNDGDPDLFAIGSSASGAEWTAILRLQDIRGPLSCPDSPIQSECVLTQWPDLCRALGACSSGDAGTDGGATCRGEECDRGNCGCTISQSGTTIAVAVLYLLLWRRRRSRSPSRKSI